MSHVHDSPEGDKLPVSAFSGREDGSWEPGTAAYENAVLPSMYRSGKASSVFNVTSVPMSAPRRHSTFLADRRRNERCPENFNTPRRSARAWKTINSRSRSRRLIVPVAVASVLISVPRQKALVMKLLETQVDEQVPNWDCHQPERKPTPCRAPASKVLDSETAFEFSGACAGCGETPYIKAVDTIGERNDDRQRTDAPHLGRQCPKHTLYTVNQDGLGPSWANSLFEDNAEYGFGMALSVKNIRKQVTNRMTGLMDKGSSGQPESQLQGWIEHQNDFEDSKPFAEAIVEQLKDLSGVSEDVASELKIIKRQQDYLIKKSISILGGDGWAYDIGYGGLTMF